MKTGLKSKTRPLRPEKHAGRFTESPQIPCLYIASSESLIQCIMVHRSPCVTLVEKFFPTRWNAERRTLLVHIDNVFSHNSRMTQKFFGYSPLKRLPHPPYSPGFSSSKFYLCGNVKSALAGREIRGGLLCS
jgi:hypothetical protein